MASLSKRDLEDLKPAVDETLRQVLGFSDSAVVTAALNCVAKGMSKSKAVDMLTPLLEDSAPKFVESLFATIIRKQAEIKTRKRSALKDDEPGKPKRKKFSHFSEEDDVGVPAVEDPGASQLSSAQIKSMMDSARQQIIARKTQLKNVNGTKSAAPATRAAPTHTPSVSETQALVNDAMQKVQRAAEIQARIKASMESTGLGAQLSAVPAARQAKETEAKAVPMAATATGPTDLILDDLGRTVDARGRVIQLPKFVPTIKANIRAKRREEFKATQQEKPQDINLNSSRFFDPRLSVPEQRTKKTFKFFEPGKFERIAQRIRAKSQLEKLQNEIAQAAKKTGISSATKLALITPKKVTSSTETPNVEWWDSVILKTESYRDLYGPQTSSGKGMSDKLTGITHLVEHPIQMRPPAESTKPVEIPIYLTKKERKKLRRQRRREAQREMSEKIRLGLEPPPEPKVRMANLMRVLGTEAVQDPTKVEAHVRAQMEKRQKTHEEANAARKLTDEQRKEKKMRKIKEDTSLGVNVALYRVKDLRNQARKFKVEANCNQLHMTGIVVLHKDVNVVVVEGGPKQQKKFQRLMLHRIKWDDDAKKEDDDDEDSDEEGEAKSKKCVLVWEGMTKERHFGEIRFKQCPTESIARELFKKHNVEHYWDLCHSQAILENADS